MHYISAEHIDRQKWDACLDGAGSSSLFAYSWYLDAVCDRWSALVFGDYEKVFPLCERRKLGIGIIYQPFFTRSFDVYSSGAVTVAEQEQCLMYCKDRFRMVQLGLPLNFAVPEKFKRQERRFQVLDLNDSYSSLYSRYSENTRRNLKKARQQGYVIRELQDGQPVVDLFRSTKGKELEVFSDKDYERLVRLMDACKKKNKGLACGVFSKSGELVAAAFFIVDRGRTVFLKSGVVAEGRKNGAMHLLFDSYIAANAGRQHLLDFGGSSVESVARFYASFGSKDCVYLQVNNDRLPAIIKRIKKIN